MTNTNGIFLGGFAQGAARSDESRRRDSQLGLNAKSIALRELDHKQRQQKHFQKRAQEAVKNTVNTISDTIKAAKSAGASRLKIRNAIGNLTRSLEGGIADAAGFDLKAFDLKINSMINAPSAGQAAIQTARDKANALGGSPEEIEANTRRFAGVTDKSGPNTLEQIRRKIATGEQLTSGETRIYDDVVRRLDPLLALAAASQQQQPQSLADMLPESNLPRPRTRAEAEALPSGARFIDPNGQIQVRP